MEFKLSSCSKANSHASGINRIIMEFKLKIINKQKQVGAELIES